MANFEVTTLNDELDATADDNGLSLREAVTLSNAAPGADTITFSDDVQGGVIRLTLGEIVITDALTIANSRAEPSGAAEISNSGDTGGAQAGFDAEDDYSTAYGLESYQNPSYLSLGSSTPLPYYFVYGYGSLFGGVTVSGDANGDDQVRSSRSIDSTEFRTTDYDLSTSGDYDYLADNTNLFRVTDMAGPFVVDGLILTGGRTTGNVAGGGAITAGAGVEVTVRNSVIAGNSTSGAGSNGGAINADGDFYGYNSIFYGNVATGDFADGGAIHSSGDVTLVKTVVAQNGVRGENGDGGGVSAGGALTVTRGAIGKNSVEGRYGKGGGLFSMGDLSITNGALFGNTTLGAYGDGGGFFSGGATSLSSSTITGNFALANGAYAGGGYSGGNLTARNSIVLGNGAPNGDRDELSTFPNLGGGGPALEFQGFNIVGAAPLNFDATISENVINADPNDVFAQTVEVNGAVAGVAAASFGILKTVPLSALQDNPALDAAGDGATPADARGLLPVDLTGLDVALRDLGSHEQRLPGVTPEEGSLVVTTTEDVVDPFDGLTSLREAIAFAYATSSSETITFAESGQGLIRLTNGTLEIADSLTIDGGGKVTITGDVAGDDVTVAGNVTDNARSLGRTDDNVRLIAASYGDGPPKTLTLKGLTLTGGRSDSDGGAVSASYFDVELIDSVISGNAVNGDQLTEGSGGRGGGVASNGNVTITNSAISDNIAYGSGGGVFATGDITVVSSTITNNAANERVIGEGEISSGGGVASDAGDVRITDSLVLRNSAFDRYAPDIASGRDDRQSALNARFIFSGVNIIGENPDDFDASDSVSVFNAPATLVFAPVEGASVPGALAGEAGSTPRIELSSDRFNPALDATTSVLQLDAAGNPRTVDLLVVDNGGQTDLGAFELQTQIAPPEPEPEPEPDPGEQPTPGPDDLTGDAGPNQIDGLRGADTIVGLGGADTLNGGGGRDVITGNGGRDVISGGGGRDDLDGNVGRDRVTGNGGRDTVKGGGGRDTLEGGGGKDLLEGGRGRDFLDGSNGADTLVGGKGNDVLTGGGGLDVFEFTRGDGRDVITDFDQLRDTIRIVDGADSFDDLRITQVGDDVQIRFANVVITVRDDQAENFTEADFMF